MEFTKPKVESPPSFARREGQGPQPIPRAKTGFGPSLIESQRVMPGCQTLLLGCKLELGGSHLPMALKGPALLLPPSLPAGTGALITAGSWGKVKRLGLAGDCVRVSDQNSWASGYPLLQCPCRWGLCRALSSARVQKLLPYHQEAGTTWKHSMFQRKRRDSGMMAKLPSPSCAFV